MYLMDEKSGRVVVRKRRQCFEEGKAPHELTFSCHNGYPFLQRDRKRKWFVDSLIAARRKWPINLWAWVIMPEHVHLIVAPRELNVRIGKIRGAIKKPVSKKAVKWLYAHAPQWIPKISMAERGKIRHRFWRAGGGYDRTVEETRTLAKMIEYIHLNPVRRGLVERAEDWEWSSARWYAGMSPVHIEMDRTLPMLED